MKSIIKSVLIVGVMFVFSADAFAFPSYSSFLPRDKVKLIKGRTNVQRMREGVAPIGSDGKSVELHHLVQQEVTQFNGKNGTLAEVSRTLHSEKYNIIHIYERNHTGYVS